MAKTLTNYAVGRPIVVAITLCICGCVSALWPRNPDEQAAALRAMPFSHATRYAVASRNTNTHTVPTHAIGDRVSAEIAAVVAERLGIQAVPLSHASGSGWSEELARAKGATGWIRMSGNNDFFRNAGFDGYVLVTLYEDVEHYGESKASATDRRFLTYDPVYHMIALPRGEEDVLLMQAGLDGRFSCEVRRERLVNEPECVDTFVKRFRRELDLRLK